MAGTFTNINIGQKAFDVSVGKHLTDTYDMVKLNLDESNYVTSPYLYVDDALWAAENLNGQYKYVCINASEEPGWAWYHESDTPTYATTAALAQNFGIEVHYPTVTPAITRNLGDEIIVTKTLEYNSYKVEASYSRQGAVLEVDCPLLRNVIPTSPYVGINPDQWETGAEMSMLPHGDGTYEFVWNGSGWSEIYEGSVVGFPGDNALYNVYGITIYYPDESSAKTTGDTITVIRQTDSTTMQPRYDYIYTQTETIAPAQKLCDAIFKAVQGISYQPLRAENAIINPAAEIGDTLTVCGHTSGLYYQETTFNRLMASNVGAPISNESEPEMEYESKQDRQYARKFADIAAEFTIQADKISAKVSKTSPVGQTSFSWELYDDHWAVLNNEKPMLYINSEGSQFTGKVRANQIVVDELNVNGQTFPAGYIEGSESGEYNQIALNSIGGGGSIGIGNLALDTVTAPNLTSDVNDDIQKGVNAYGMIAYGFDAISAGEVYAGSLNVAGGTGGDYTNAYWCYNRVSGTNLYYLGHY